MIWAANASAGHTKKTTVIALYHVGYGIGNIISPQLFRPQWKVSLRASLIMPFNDADIPLPATIQTNLDHFASGEYILWSQAASCDFGLTIYQIAAIVPAIIVMTLRIYLSRENSRRDRLEAQNQITDNGIIETTNADGSKDIQVVDKNQLDLTDRQNLKL